MKPDAEIKATPTAEAAPAAAERTVRETTRGAAIITLAKGWFLVTGFAQPLLLTRVLHTEGYGLYGVVLNVVSILNNVVVAGSIQAMSHAVTEGGPAALRRGLRIHFGVGLTLAGGLVAVAGPLGAGALHDARLPSLLRIGAVVVFNYSVYAALVGALNGQRRFRDQAALDMTFATLRTALVIGVAAVGFGVAGALVGFALASTIILALALWLSRAALRPGATAAPGDEPAPALAVAPVTFGAFAARYGRFFAPVLVYQLALNLVLQSDLLVFKAILARRAVTAAASGLAVNDLVGIYKAVQNFAFLPYQLLLAVTFVIFPVVSRATLEGDRDTTARFVAGATRFSLLALGAMLAVLTGLPRGVLRIAYRPPFDEGYAALRLLSVAQGCFALSVISTTILVAAGRTRQASLLMGAMLMMVTAGNVAGLTFGPGGTGALAATAAGTLTGCALGLVLIGLWVKKTFGAFVSPVTVLRVALSTTVAAATVAAVPLQGKVATLGLAGVAVAVYAACIALSRELTGEEIGRIVRVLRKTGPKG